MGIIYNKIDRKQLKRGDHIYSWRTAYLFAHHGIYVNERKVIHFTTGARQEPTGASTSFNSLFTSSAPSFDTNNIPCPICGDPNETRTNNAVFSSCLDCFLSGGELYLFLYGVNKLHFLVQARGGTCTLASSDPTEEVIYRAIYLLENGFGDYNVFKNNCEDFAIYCKTGLLVIGNISGAGGSGQAASCSAAASSVATLSLRFVTASFCSLTLAGCGTYCIGRLVSDIRFRHEVLKDAKKVPVEKIHEMAPEKKCLFGSVFIQSLSVLKTKVP